MDSGRQDPTVKSVSEPGKVSFAREQRRQPTEAECILWQCLRNCGLGVRFRRQHPFEGFVLDFYSAEQRLAVEIDGPVHEEQRGYDEWRDGQLSQHSIRVLRIPEAMVSNDLDEVLGIIRDELQK